MLHPRARTMLLLSLPAMVVGITPSLILIMVMKIVSVLQNLLRQQLLGTLGIAQDSPFWIIGVLTLTGIAMRLVIRFSQGHAGPDPACEPLIDAPVPPSTLPGLTVALILSLADGVNLGPEHPTTTVNTTLAVAIGARLLPRVNRMGWTILASAGTIGALFGTPVATALIFSQTLNGSSEVPLWDRLFAPLMTAAVDALTTGLLFHPHSSLPIACYGQIEMIDVLSGAIVTAIIVAAGMITVWCLPRLHAMMYQIKNPVLVLNIDEFILGILGAIGGSVSLFKGLDEVQQMMANQAFSASDYFLLAVIKLAVLVIAAAGDFRGGRIFPAVFVSVALRLMLHEHVPTVPTMIAVSRVILGIVLMVTRDGWLSPFMAAVVVPNTTLLPLFCIAMLPTWLLLAGKPMMMVNRPKQQPPRDSVQQKMLSFMI